MNLYIASILCGFIFLDLLVLRRMYVLLRNLRHRRSWRAILAVMAFMAIAFCVVEIFANPILGGTRDPFPRWLVGSLYIWHFLMLPLMLAAMWIDLLVRALRGGWRFVHAYFTQKTPDPSPAPPASILSRRHFLTSLGMTAVPAAAVSLGAIATTQIGKFRIKPYELAIAGWPRELDGYTITVVADVHTGAFSTQKMLDDIADATNRLRSDLVLLAGDLVNISLADLPSALDMVLRMDAPDGMYMIQGNHDVIQGPDHFNAAVRRRGVKLLVDEVATIIPARRNVPFQVLGTRWAVDPFRDESVAYTAALRDPAMFALMLAHHPHSWDAAADSGIPLVISGHTHGGQIMLTNRIGAGPLKFKYWSGRYDKPNSTLIVSNGVGNWFPLRVNAPAEILQITLHPLRL
jgi:predicted MPP superfamily phosphohydrolase